MRRASAVRGVDLTCVRSTVRPLTPPYLHPTGYPCRVGHVDGPIVQGREDVAVRSTSCISFFAPPPREDLLEVPDYGAEDEVLCSSAGLWWPDPTEQELENLNGAGADPTKQELENLNGAGADPTEQELENLNGAGANPTEQELENLNGAGSREFEFGILPRG
ncbi:hypothetical protein B296_00001698 [Ensete ventricosum]|uniref:Uncharacterized protein n=1 Tax=Ensete ventricosum TaxID=4639 RepID=A0A426ZW70_ENSVE|nr:hypothetical protein B296_00001698 [Ensete ventricosum]